MKKFIVSAIAMIATVSSLTGCTVRTWTEKAIAVSAHELKTSDGNIYSVDDTLMYYETYVVKFSDCYTPTDRRDDIILSVQDLESYELDNMR